MIQFSDGCIYSTAETKEERDKETEQYISLYYKTKELGECPVMCTPVCKTGCIYKLSTTADYKDGIINICRFRRKGEENDGL